MTESALTKYSPDAMRIELLPSYGNDIQQKIADVSDMIFSLQQDRTGVKAISMLKLAAEQLKICSLSDYKGKISAISYARLIDKADSADKEAERISDSLQSSYISLYKENILLDTMKKMLEDCVSELQLASKALKEHIHKIGNDEPEKYYTDLAWKRIQDMTLSETIAARSIFLITDMSANNNMLLERINSLKVNTLVLWRTNLYALKASPDEQKLERICGIEDAISAAIASIVK